MVQTSKMVVEQPRNRRRTVSQRRKRLSHQLCNLENKSCFVYTSTVPALVSSGQQINLASCLLSDGHGTSKSFSRQLPGTQAHRRLLNKQNACSHSHFHSHDTDTSNVHSAMSAKTVASHFGTKELLPNPACLRWPVLNADDRPPTSS